MSKLATSYDHIRDNPRFQALVSRRNRHAYGLTALMIAVYFTYILLIAFRPQWLAMPLANGMVTPWGIVLGLAIIVLTVGVTSFYVWRANHEFDREAGEIRKDSLR
ncbi:MAG: DUF485 domain-containing protein [Dechloromonas sp.]|nr:DUF485 domain-containing protein [Dechloromonas sp.]